MNPLTLARGAEAHAAKLLPLTRAAAPELREVDPCRAFGDLGELDAKAVAPALYAILVHDRRTGELLGRYPADSGDLGLDRARAVAAATTEAEASWDWSRADRAPDVFPPPDGSEVYCVEEYR